MPGRIASFFRNVLRKRAVEQALDDELQSAVELLRQEKMKEGLSHSEARRQALIELGGVEQVKEEVRAIRSGMFLETFAQDLRYTVRILRKSPVFTAVAVLTLALGIGVNATIFSMVNGVLFRGLPVPHPSGLVSFGFSYKGYQGFSSSYLDLQDVQRQADRLVDLFAYQIGMDGLTVGNHTDRIVTNYVTGNYFAELGVEPALGRLILPSEGEPGGYDPIVVLSYSYWQSRFGANPSIIGKSVRLNGKPMTVVGVAQKGYHGSYLYFQVQAFLPLNAFDGPGFPWTNPKYRMYRSLNVLGRLRPGVPLSRANAAVQVIASRLAREHPESDPDAKAWLLSAMLTGISPTGLEPQDVPQVLVIYALCLTLALLVLLVACFTLANLLLARATARQQEMAVRAALGAGPGQLLKQALAETGLLAGLGCAAGLLLGFFASRLLEAIRIRTGRVPLIFDFGFDGHVFLYAAGAAILAVFLAGVSPAVRASRSNPCDALHDGAPGVIGGRNRFRKVLVAAQIAASVVLLVATGIATRSLIAVEHTKLGFNPSHLFMLNMDAAEAGYDQTRGEELYKGLLPRIRALRGVQSAALAYTYPSNPGFDYQVQAENRPIPAGQVAPTIGMNAVSPGYFETMQIPILRGRAFLETDTAKSTQVAIVNETLAHQLWPNEDPLGKRFGTGPTGPWAAVVGVAADSTYAEVSKNPTPYFYLPVSRFYTSYETLLVRTQDSPETMIRTVEAQVRALAPTVPVWGAQTMRQTLASSFGGFSFFRFSAIMAVTVGLLGLALAIGGVYGVVSYDVGRRTHEIGIRIALGARPRNIQRIIFRQGLAMLMAGLFFGILGALGFAAIEEHFLGGFGAPDPLTYLGVAILISTATLLACYVPALRAMKVDPMVALRYQ